MQYFDIPPYSTSYLIPYCLQSSSSGTTIEMKNRNIIVNGNKWELEICKILLSDVTNTQGKKYNDI